MRNVVFLFCVTGMAIGFGVMFNGMLTAVASDARAFCCSETLALSLIEGKSFWLMLIGLLIAGVSVILCPSSTKKNAQS